MDRQTTGPELIVQGQDGFRSEVIERAKRMLAVVLEAADMPGEWHYRVTGPSERFRHESRYRLEMELASHLLPDRVHVTVKAGVGPGGAIAGMLQLPPGSVRTQLIARVAPTIAILNQSGWQDVLDHEERQPAFVVGRPINPAPKGRAKKTKGSCGTDLTSCPKTIHRSNGAEHPAVPPRLDWVRQEPGKGGGTEESRKQGEELSCPAVKPVGGTLAELLRQREVLDQQLLAEKNRLERWGIAAEQNSARAHSAAESFNQKVQEALGSAASPFLCRLK